MPRYELAEGTSRKFWEVERTGRSFTARWGRLGADAQEKTQTFESEAAAKEALERLVAAKVKEGYQLVAPSAPAPRKVLTVRLESPPSVKGIQWRELSLADDVLKQTTGVVGKHEPPQVSREQHASPGEAAEMLERLVSVYRKRGFQEVFRRTETLADAPPEAPPVEQG